MFIAWTKVSFLSNDVRSISCDLSFCFMYNILRRCCFSFSCNIPFSVDNIFFSNVILSIILSFFSSSLFCFLMIDSFVLFSIDNIVFSTRIIFKSASLSSTSALSELINSSFPFFSLSSLFFSIESSFRFA